MYIFKKLLAEALSEQTDTSSEALEGMLATVPSDKSGDIALPCFAFAKKLRKSPAAIASELADTFTPPSPFIKAEAAGPYLNFIADPKALAESILSHIHDDEGGILSNPPTSEVYVIDYSSPNAAKPFSIGHLRSTVIGHSLKQILEYLGHHVVGINHLGDWGTGFGKLVVAFRKWGQEESMDMGVRYLLDLYVQFHQAAKEDPSLEDEARAAFAALENGDPETRKLWQRVLEVSWKEISRIYDRLGVSFEHVTGESFYEPMLQPLVAALKDKGIAVSSEGAVIIEMKEDMPPLLLVKSDGSTLYATRDLSAALYRRDTFNPSRILYVVGSEQKLHFQQLGLALNKIDPDVSIEHVDFGLYRFADRKMSTREGHVIFMEEVLDRAVAMTRDIIHEKNPDLEKIDETAEKVGIGAIVFGDLYNDRIKTVEFDWDRVLDFNGETGPYVQYSYARICGIIRKADSLPEKIDFSLLSESETQDLIKLMADLPGAAVKAGELYKPSVIARYSVDLARGIARFYQAHQVLKAEPAVRDARLFLLDRARECLGCSMDLLGIARLERM